MEPYERHREEIILSETKACQLETFTGLDLSHRSSIVTSDAISDASRWMDDVVTPDFTKIVKNGGIVNNPMTSVDVNNVTPAVKVNINCSLLYPIPTVSDRCNMIGTRSMSDIQDMQPLPVPTLDVPIASLSDRAITSAWANIGTNEMLLLATTAECNQSVQGLVWLVRKAARIAKAVRKKQLRQLKREITWKEMQEVYMNARYNLRPLAYDIEGIMNILNDGIKKPERQTFRGFTVDTKSVSEDSESSLLYKWYLDYRMKISKVSSATITARAGVLTNASLNNYGQALGLDKLVETVWDLTPYSFILDWFANVGDTLSSWAPSTGFTTLTSWVVTEQVEIQKVYFKGLTYPTDVPYGAGRGVDNGSSADPVCLIRSVRVKTRTPNYQRPLLPTFRVNLDPLKLLDLTIIGKNIRKNAAYVR